MSDRDGKPDDVLERAIAALRNAPVPDGPPPHLAASTVEALQGSTAPPRPGGATRRRRVMFQVVRYGAVAAALAVVVGVGGWLALFDRGGSVAFADVIKNVNDAKSVTFVTKIPSTIRGERRGVLKQKFYIQGDAYRMEIPSAQEGAEVPADAPPVVAAMVADWKNKNAIMLDFTAKTFKKIEADEKTWAELAKGLADPIKQLRELKEQDAEKLPDEELDGKKTHVYRLKGRNIFMGLTQDKDETTKLWVDPKTGLPVRITLGDPTELQKPFVVFEEFRWNEKLDAAMFKLEAPGGFTEKKD